MSGTTDGDYPGGIEPKEENLHTVADQLLMENRPMVASAAWLLQKARVWYAEEFLAAKLRIRDISDGRAHQHAVLATNGIIDVAEAVMALALQGGCNCGKESCCDTHADGTD